MEGSSLVLPGPHVNLSLEQQVLMPPQDPQSQDPSFPILLASARRGDREAMESLCRNYYPTVERMVHARLRQDYRNGRPWLSARFSTGDVVQNVFRELLRDLNTFRGSTPESFCSYLAMMVRNRIIDAVRHHEASKRDGRRTVNINSSYDGIDGSPSPGSCADRTEQQDLFDSALSTFAEREQFLLRGRFEHDAPFHELADQLGYSSPSAAKRAFYQAQAQLVLMLRRAEDHAE